MFAPELLSFGAFLIANERGTNMEPTTYSSLHHAVALLERRACMDWMDLNALGTDLEIVLAQYAETVTVMYQRTTGGYVSVTVSIGAYDERFDHQQWFPLQRAGNRAYVQPEPSIIQ